MKTNIIHTCVFTNTPTLDYICKEKCKIENHIMCLKCRNCKQNYHLIEEKEKEEK